MTYSWALLFGLNKWCEKYPIKNLLGEGTYSGDIPQGEVKAFFDITYLPPIFELVADEKACSLEIKKKEIRIPAETKGLVRVPSPDDVRKISASFDKNNKNLKHQFNFQDTMTNKNVGGEVMNVYSKPLDGPNILELKAGDLSFT